jgi:uncharacterized protein (TIGR03437 family)
VVVPAFAQLTIDTFAGGTVRSGVPAQSVFLDDISGITSDLYENVVFCGSTNNVIRRVRTDGTLETIAGTGVTGFGGDSGPATAALLNTPVAPHYDASGNLYFADTYNYRIRRIDANGIITTVAGDGIPYVSGMDISGPASTRSLALVADVAIVPSGNLYVWERDQNRLRIVTPDGQIRPFVGLTDGDYQTGSLASDAAGNLYMVRTEGLLNPAIVRIAPDGSTSVVRAWGANTRPQPLIRALAADAKGNIYAAESDGVVRYGPDGSASTLAGGGSAPLSSPDGPAAGTTISPSFVAIDPLGNVIFAENFVTARPPTGLPRTLNEIRVITTDSQLKTIAGGNPTPVPDGTPLRSAWFWNLQGLAISYGGVLYMGDSRACKVYRIGTDGSLSTFAGTGTCVYATSSGSNAKTAAITEPASIALDSQNRIWLLDTGLNLYSIAPDGTTSPSMKPPIGLPPAKIAIDSKDRIYVAGINSLYRILADGSSQAIIAPPSMGGTGIPNLSGIGSGPDGKIYFAANGTIYTVNDDGTFVPAYPMSDYNFGSSVAVDAAGRVWQSGGNEIDVAQSGGVARLGVGGGFAGDGGPVNSARIAAGWVAFSPTGDLYVMGQNRVRRLTGLGSAVPTPAISAVVNAASYAGPSVAPGELVAIFGSNFGTSVLQAATPHNNVYPLSLGRTRVQFNGQPGAITAVTPNQINVFVPVLGLGSTVSVAVVVDSVLSSSLVIPVAVVAPGISTADSSGSGQGAILNQDGSLNSRLNPAPPVSVISLFGAGLGLSTPQLSDGALVISTPFPAPQNQVTATIGGVAAEVLYAGAAPLLPSGVFQVNVRVPAGTATGDATVAVAVGGISSAQQVTVAVR